MNQAFSIIILLMGATYAIFTKQAKTALGFLILAISFALVIPNLATGFWADFFGAFSMLLLLIGVIVIVKKEKENIDGKN